MTNQLKKISDLPAGTPLDTDIIPYVDLVAGATKKALKSELKGDQGDAATVDAGTTTTLAAGESATVTNVGTTSDAIFNFGIPQGIQGDDGACVESVAFVGDDMVFTLDDASTVTLVGAVTTLKGETGDTGASIISASFVGDDLVFVKDDSSTVTLTGALTSLKGDTGNGIASIIKTGTVGLVDTYTITYDDATTSTFDVTNGLDGTDGDDGAAATITIGTVTTVADTEPATVTNSGTSSAAIFDFEIPKGADGEGSGDMILADAQSVTGLKTFDTTKLAVKGSSTGSTAIASANASATDYTATLPAKDGTIAMTSDIVSQVEDSIVDGHTTIAPSGNAVFDALAEKAPLASPTFTGTVTLADNARIDLTLPTADTYVTGNTTDSFASGYSSAVGDLVFFGSGGKWLEVDADAVATCNGLLGIALEAKTDGQAMKVALPGSFVRLDSWNWTVGATLYAGETLGAMQETISTGADAIIKVVGFAVSADVIYFNPSPDQQSTVA